MRLEGRSEVFRGTSDVEDSVTVSYQFVHT